MTVCVLGLGYIGLPLALLLADSGVSVVGFDVDERKLSELSNGNLPLIENGLEQLFSSVKNKKTFTVSDKVPLADAYIVAVPTPQTNHQSDLSYVLKSLEYIQPNYKKNSLIILESTVGPSDCGKIIVPQLSKWNVPFRFAHCPERAVPGNTLKEMTTNDRVIGGVTKKDAQLAKKLYQHFVTGSISLTTPNQAATVKTMENTYRAVNIALANEFAKIAHELKLDVWEAIELANHHPRVHIHLPSIGVGGHCIPVDPWFFVGESKESKLIETALQVNNQMPEYIAMQLKQLILTHKLKNPVIGILGYTYKKNVDDVRETPVQTVIDQLLKSGTVLVNDPYISQIKGQKTTDLKTVLSKSSMIVLATNHDQYASIVFKQYPNVKIVFDAHNLFSTKNFKQSAAHYYSLGRV